MNLSKEKTHLNLMICLSAHRSIAAVRLMTEMGHENVFQLKGGMQDWRAKQLPEISEE
jgi:rhodanese-related sulfurtransferase